MSIFAFKAIITLLQLCQLLRTDSTRLAAEALVFYFTLY